MDGARGGSTKSTASFFLPTPSVATPVSATSTGSSSSSAAAGSSGGSSTTTTTTTTTANKILNVEDVLALAGLTRLDELAVLTEEELRSIYPDLNKPSFDRLQAALEAHRAGPSWWQLQVQSLLSLAEVAVVAAAAFLLAYFQMSPFALVLLVLLAFNARRQSLRRFVTRLQAITEQTVRRDLAASRGESAAWANVLVQHCWTSYRELLQTQLVDLLNPMLYECRIFGMDDCAVHELDLGAECPELVHIRAFDVERDEDTHKFDVRLRYNAPASLLSLRVRLGGHRAGVNAFVAAKRFAAEAFVRITLNVDFSLPPPHLRTVAISLLEEPSIDFSLTPIGNLDLRRVFGGLDSWLDSLITNLVCDMLLTPESMEFAIADPTFREEGSDGLLSGILLVDIRSAYDIQLPENQDRRTRRAGRDGTVGQQWRSRLERYVFEVAVDKGESELVTDIKRGVSPTWFVV